jgi:hypothetical protein
VMKSYMPTLNHRVENRRHGWYLGLILFRLVAPPLQSGVVGPFPGTGCMVPQSFVVGGNWSYPRFLGHNQWPTVPEVNYPDNMPFMDTTISSCGDTKTSFK